MPDRTAPVVEPPVAPPIKPARKARPQESTRVERLPPHAVFLHNDPINRMEFVVGVLRRVFRYNALRCIRLMLIAHFRGRVSVWVGSLEVAELKADQIRSAGPDPQMKSRGAQRLTVSVEKLP